MRAPEMEKLKKRHSVGWGTTDGKMEERKELRGRRCLKWRESTMDQSRRNREPSLLVLDLARAFERVSFPVVWKCEDGREMGEV